MKYHGLFAALVISSIVCPQPVLASPRADVLAAETILNRAVQAHDVATTAKYITDDYSLTLGSGRFLDHKSFMALIADRSITLTINRSHDQRVRFYGSETAIVTGIVEEAGSAGGKAFDMQVPFTDTWVMQSGRWVQAAGHASQPLSKAPPRP